MLDDYTDENGEKLDLTETSQHEESKTGVIYLTESFFRSVWLVYQGAIHNIGSPIVMFESTRAMHMPLVDRSYGEAHAKKGVEKWARQRHNGDGKANHCFLN